MLYEINEGFKEKMYNLLPSQIGRILAQEVINLQVYISPSKCVELTANRRKFGELYIRH